MVFGAPLPLDPAADLPTADQITGVLNGLADPASRSPARSAWSRAASAASRPAPPTPLMKNAVAKGQIRLNFTVGNITRWARRGQCHDHRLRAVHAADHPDRHFVDQGGWKLSRSSARRCCPSSAPGQPSAAQRSTAERRHHRGGVQCFRAARVTWPRAPSGPLSATSPSPATAPPPNQDRCPSPRL